MFQLPEKCVLAFTSPDCPPGLEAWLPTLGESGDSFWEPVLIWKPSSHFQKHVMSRLWMALTFPGLSLGLSSGGTLARGTGISMRGCLGSSDRRLSWAFYPFLACFPLSPSLIRRWFSVITDQNSLLLFFFFFSKFHLTVCFLFN